MTKIMPDAEKLAGLDIEFHVKDGEFQLLLAGNDITPLLSRASWYWQPGQLPRLSFDVSEISTLDVFAEVSRARFRRKQ